MKRSEVKIGETYLHTLEGKLWQVRVTHVERNREYPAGHPKGHLWEGTCSEGVCWGYVSDLAEGF